MSQTPTVELGDAFKTPVEQADVDNVSGEYVDSGVAAVEDHLAARANGAPTAEAKADTRPTTAEVHDPEDVHRHPSEAVRRIGLSTRQAYQRGVLTKDMVRRMMPSQPEAYLG